MDTEVSAKLKVLMSMDEEFLNINIVDTDLPEPTKMLLYRNGIFTISQLKKHIDNDFSEIHGIGAVKVQQINDMLNNLGFFIEKSKERKLCIESVYDDVYNIAITQIKLSNRSYNALYKANIQTVGDLLQLSKQDILQLHSLESKGRNEINNVIDEIILYGKEYFDDNHNNNVCTDKFSVSEEQLAEKGFDFEIIDVLKDEFSLSTVTLMDWFEISSARIYELLRKRPQSRERKWTGKELSESEYYILFNLVQNKDFKYSDNNVQCTCFNNKSDNFVAIFVYENEIKCFFMSSLPDTLRDMIFESNMQKYTEKEIEGESDGTIVYSIKKPYFMPKYPDKFRNNASLRGMAADEYAVFLSGYPVTDSRRVTDDQIIDFLENSKIDGKVYISSDHQNQWIRSLASRNGYGIKEFVELYGYEYYSEGRELTEEGARQRHIQELQKYIVDENTVYFPTDSRIYKILQTYSYKKNIAINDYIQSLGFERTTTPPEKQFYKSEEDMQIRESDGKWEERVFAKYPLLGSKIIARDILDKLDENTKTYIDKVLHEPGLELPVRAKMQITLSVINKAKKWDNDEDSKFWEYITLQYGYRNASGAVERLIKNSIEDSLKENRKLFIESQYGREFKSTVVVHALTTKKSWMALFDFLFDFYKNNLNWKFVPGEPLIINMIRALQIKFSGIESDDTEIISIGAQAYRFQEGIRKLIILRPGYARDLFENLLGRIDELINSADVQVKTYEEQLCDEWFKEKLISITNPKKRIHDEHSVEREVALDYSRIRVKFILYNEDQLRVALPDIRLKDENFSRALLTIRYGEKIVYQQPMSWYGNELGKTLHSVSVPLPDFTNYNESFNIQISINCDDEEIYNSDDELYFKLLAFSGKKEVKFNRIGLGNYTLIFPVKATLECENINLTSIDSFKTGGLKAYFAELKEGYFLTMNGSPVAFDHATGLDIRVIAPSESGGAPTFWVEDTEYHFVNKDSYCSVIIDNPKVLNRYALLVNGERISLERMPKTVPDQGEVYTIPITEENSYCKIQLLNMENEKLLYERNFYKVPSISSNFNREFYYSNDDYENANYRLQIKDFCETVYFTREDDEIQIPYKNGSIHTLVPKIKTEENTGEWFNSLVPAWYIDEIPQNSLLKISSPDDVSIKFLVGGIDIQYDGKGLLGIGDVLHSLRGSDETSNVWIEMEVSGSQTNQMYDLARVFYREGFLKKPHFWTEQNQLFWDRGGSFIGKTDRIFTLQLEGDDKKNLTFEIDNDTTSITLPENIPIGNYQYEISILSGGLFKSTKKIIAEGDCIIGDENSLRFRGYKVVIDSITDDSREKAGHIIVKQCYIDQIEYHGEQDTSEGFCPVYSGILFSEGHDGQRFEFSFSEHINSKGRKKMMVNPVRIVFINDNTLCITDPERDGLYYYNYYDKYLEQIVFLLTDQAYTKDNRDRYSVADLYSYHMERE